MKAPSTGTVRPRRTAPRLAATLAVLGPLAWIAPVSSEPSTKPTTQDAATAKKALEARRAELEAMKHRAAALEQDVRDIDEVQAKLNARLVETGTLIQSSEARMSAMEQRLGELDAQRHLLTGSLDQRHDQIAKLLSGLLRMGRNPPPVMVTRREDALQMVRSAMLVSATVPELGEQARSLATRLDELVRVMNDIRAEGERLKTETARLSEARTRLASLMDSKRRSLSERQTELSKLQRSANDVSTNVKELSDLIAQLDKAVTASTGLGAYDEELRREETRLAAAPPPTLRDSLSANSEPTPTDPSATTGSIQPGPKPDTTKAEAQKPVKVAVAVPPKSSVVELAPAGSASALGNPGRIKPAIPFQQAKGRLPLPAQGKRVIAYGDKTQSGASSKGLVVETRSGAQITSPSDGWIVYAGEFRSYGQLLIINAGGGYHILLAGLSQIDVQPGQFVLAAEPVGTMSGSPTAGAGKGSTASPVLYIEFRKDGRPIDPDPWWVDTQRNGQQKVQG